MLHRYKIRVIVIVALFVLLYYHNSMGQIGSGVTACNRSGSVSCRDVYPCAIPSCGPRRILSKIELNQNGNLDVVYIFVELKAGKSLTYCDGGIYFYCNGRFCGLSAGEIITTPDLAQDLMSLPLCFNCEISISVSGSEVWPKGAGNDDKTTATIMVTATNPPPEGCTINFKVEPVENSGGHSHHDDSRRKGTVTPPTLTIPAGSSEPVYALYSSSDISGQEKIIVEVNGSKADEKMIEVKVPDLMPLDSLSWYNLTGADAISSHPANHYGTNSTKVAVYNMASDYWNEIRTRLGINDMSLEWGGLFDVNENWSSPHSLHRTGESVDIDRCADGVLVNQKRLDKIALRYDGERIVEEALRPPPCSGPADTPRIHYEF